MPVRLRIVQPLIAAYREPFFAALAARPEIDLEVWADLDPRQGSLAGASGSDRFRCVHAPYRELGPLILQSGVLRAVRRGAVDVVVLPWNTRFAHLLPALFRARACGIRAILWGHGIGKRETPARRRLRSLVGRLADAAILYSPGVAESLIAEGWQRERVFVAPNSIDQSAVLAARDRWTPERVRSRLEQFGCRPGSVVLFVSRLEPWKRVERLIDAFGIVAASRPEARLVIIGDGSQRSALEERASLRGVRERTSLLGSIYDEDELAPWMLGAACMAFPAAIGLSLLHAFGYGLPVVTSDDRLPHGPEIEALGAGRNGLLFPGDDIDAFAEAIGSMLDDEPLRKRLGDEASRTVHRVGGWNLDSMVNAFVAAARGTQPRADA